MPTFYLFISVTCNKIPETETFLVSVRLDFVLFNLALSKIMSGFVRTRKIDRQEDRSKLQSEISENRKETSEI